MADQGFKIKTDLAMKQCILFIPPSAAKGNQTFSDVKKTSNIPNIRIYVEQAIKHMKEFHILKTHQLILYLLIFNDIVRVIASFVNFKKTISKRSIITKPLKRDVRMQSTMKFFIKKSFYFADGFLFEKIIIKI